MRDHRLPSWRRISNTIRFLQADFERIGPALVADRRNEFSLVRVGRSRPAFMVSNRTGAARSNPLRASPRRAGWYRLPRCGHRRLSRMATDGRGVSTRFTHRWPRDASAASLLRASFEDELRSSSRARPRPDENAVRTRVGNTWLEPPHNRRSLQAYARRKDRACVADFSTTARHPRFDFQMLRRHRIDQRNGFVERGRTQNDAPKSRHDAPATLLRGACELRRHGLLDRSASGRVVLIRSIAPRCLARPAPARRPADPFGMSFFSASISTSYGPAIMSMPRCRHHALGRRHIGVARPTTLSTA